MLKKDLIDLVNALRAENSTLRTQLDAARATRTPAGRQPTPAALQAACARLAAQHPHRRSFTGEEVRQACSA